MQCSMNLLSNVLIFNKPLLIITLLFNLETIKSLPFDLQHNGASR